MWDEEEDNTIYKVVINHEEQYSIWPAHRDNPAGWNDVGKSGPKAECLAYIDEVWTDMRPLSLRKAMEAREREQAQQGAPGGQGAPASGAEAPDAAT
jgi:MbtH protein